MQNLKINAAGLLKIQKIRAVFKLTCSHKLHSTITLNSQKKNIKKRDPEQGDRWVKQAKVDYEILLRIYNNIIPQYTAGYSHVCFMAHQVVEKALKGAVYALCGMDGRSLKDHHLSRHASILQAIRPNQTAGLLQHCITLETYYLKTRYPNHWPTVTKIPSDFYTCREADEAKDHANAVLDIVTMIMPSKDH